MMIQTNVIEMFIKIQLKCCTHVLNSIILFIIQRLQCKRDSYLFLFIFVVF